MSTCYYDVEIKLAFYSISCHYINMYTLQVFPGSNMMSFSTPCASFLIDVNNLTFRNYELRFITRFYPGIYFHSMKLNDAGQVKYINL